MYTAKVIGHVVATQKDVSLAGAKLLIVRQVDSGGNWVGKPHVAVDTIGSGADEYVTIVRGREASMPLPNPVAPVDAAAVGIVDSMTRTTRAGGGVGGGSVDGGGADGGGAGG